MLWLIDWCFLLLFFIHEQFEHASYRINNFILELLRDCASSKTFVANFSLDEDLTFTIQTGEHGYLGRLHEEVLNNGSYSVNFSCAWLFWFRFVHFHVEIEIIWIYWSNCQTPVLIDGILRYLLENYAFCGMTKRVTVLFRNSIHYQGDQESGLFRIFSNDKFDLSYWVLKGLFKIILTSDRNDVFFFILVEELEFIRVWFGTEGFEGNSL